MPHLYWQELAQRALVAYLRSVFLQPNRAVFDVAALPAAAFALSLGLPTAPQLRFLDRAARKAARAAAGGTGGGPGEAGAAGHDAKSLAGAGGEGGDGRAAGRTGAEADGLEGAGSRGAEGRDAAHDGLGEAAGPSAREQRAASGAAATNAAPAVEATDEGADGDDEDFLVVKRRDVLGVGEQADASYKDLKKSDLEGALDEFIAEHSSRLANRSDLAGYFNSRSKALGSPVKKERESKDDSDKPLKVAKRRITKAVEDIAECVTSFLFVVDMLTSETVKRHRLPLCAHPRAACRKSPRASPCPRRRPTWPTPLIALPWPCASASPRRTTTLA